MGTLNILIYTFAQDLNFDFQNYKFVSSFSYNLFLNLNLFMKIFCELHENFPIQPDDCLAIFSIASTELISLFKNLLAAW